MDKAPGLRIIILTFIIFIFSVIFYSTWYYQIEKITTQELFSLKKKLLNKDIVFTWDTTTKSGFPYRVEKELNNISIKFKDINFSTQKLKIIYQPWNKQHIIFLFPNNITIQYMDKNIIINNSELLASLTIDKFFKRKISIVSDKIRFNFPKKSYDIKNIEIHLRTNDTDDLKLAILIDKLTFPPLFTKENTINKLYIDGKAIKYKNFDINNYYNWFAKEGGIYIKNFKLTFNKTNISGNSFISLDKNYDLQNTISIKSNNFNNIFSLLEKNNFIQNGTLKKANLIINAIEIASEASSKKAVFSISMQNGYLYFMGIKLIKTPNFKGIL